MLSPQELRELMPAAKSVRDDIPVLFAEFNTKALGSNITASHLGYGAFKAAGAEVPTVRLQINSTQLYWLANAADPKVKELMHAWKKARTCGVVAGDSNGRCVLLYVPFTLHPRVQEAMSKSEHGPASLKRFQEGLAPYLEADALRANASSDIKSVPILTDVKVALLVTQFTTGPGNGFTQQAQNV